MLNLVMEILRGWRFQRRKLGSWIFVDKGLGRRNPSSFTNVRFQEWDLDMFISGIWNLGRVYQDGLLRNVGFGIRNRGISGRVRSREHGRRGFQAAEPSSERGFFSAGTDTKKLISCELLVGRSLNSESNGEREEDPKEGEMKKKKKRKKRKQKRVHSKLVGEGSRCSRNRGGKAL
jgi:hypothetical protein